MKDSWADTIVNAKKEISYMEMRARIALRKVGKRFSPDDVAAEVQKIRKSQGSPVSSGDVIRAMSRGEEVTRI
jgi:hypothetical protein